MLEKAKDNILPEVDLMKSLRLMNTEKPNKMRKRWREMRERMEEAGYIERIRVGIASTAEGM